MAIGQLDWWFDNQQRRFLEQVVRAFSGFQYMTGRRTVNGVDIPPQLKMVPCTMAQTDRLVGHVLRNNSENTVNSAPRITVAHVGLAGRRGDVQHPAHVETLAVNERDIDPVTNRYVVGNGNVRPTNSYNVQRIMPRPFEMTINVDIWTTNQDQKYQLMEQILTVVYPDFQIQNSVNPLDWTALTMMELTDINWSSRAIPVGTDSEIDICTLTFRLPFWLSPPAKVQQQRIIEQIVANVYNAPSDSDLCAIENDLLLQVIVTPGDFILSVENGIARLLGPKGEAVGPDGKPYQWLPLLNKYGTLRPTLSTIHLKTQREQIDDPSHDIIGTLQFDTNDPTQLFWQLDIDTLPVNTLAPIDGVIQPHRTSPGYGLPGNSNGQRYIVLDNIEPGSQNWGGILANANDIIEYRNGQWTVAYSPKRLTAAPDYVLNLKSGNQLRWDGEDWVKSIDGHYPTGYWRLKL